MFTFNKSLRYMHIYINNKIVSQGPLWSMWSKNEL